MEDGKHSSKGLCILPHFHYRPDFKGAQVKVELYNCLKRMVPDVNEMVKIDLQLDLFKNARGLFGMESAVLTRSKKSLG